MSPFLHSSFSPLPNTECLYSRSFYSFFPFFLFPDQVPNGHPLTAAVVEMVPAAITTAAVTAAAAAADLNSWVI